MDRLVDKFLVKIRGGARNRSAPYYVRGEISRHIMSGAKYRDEEVCTPVDEEMGPTMCMGNRFP